MTNAKKVSKKSTKEVNEVTKTEVTEVPEVAKATETLEGGEYIPTTDIVLNGVILRKGEKVEIAKEDIERVKHLVKKA